MVDGGWWMWALANEDSQSLQHPGFEGKNQSSLLGMSASEPSSNLACTRVW
eukprot:m.528703 g.528703  ORF g.528703 m.528703 type:complete len:51 (-) comp185818_c0_seq1:102-254(-)